MTQIFIYLLIKLALKFNLYDDYLHQEKAGYEQNCKSTIIENIFAC
jgi:hypothetical protein